MRRRVCASQPASLLATRGLEPAAAPTAARTLVIGYGSPIRGDDAIGPLAADALAAGPLPPGLQVLSRHVLTAELAEDLAAVDRVIVLDAAAQGRPGEVQVRKLQPDAHALSTMAHFLDPRELLAWCDTLYERAPEAWLVSAAGESFDYACYHLGPAAAEALPVMLTEVRRLVDAPRAHAEPAASAPRCAKPAATA
jgi:hydrogenase maturation protease